MNLKDLPKNVQQMTELMSKIPDGDQKNAAMALLYMSFQRLAKDPEICLNRPLLAHSAKMCQDCISLLIRQHITPDEMRAFIQRHDLTKEMEDVA